MDIEAVCGKSVPFFKMQGCGNDFVCVDNRVLDSRTVEDGTAIRRRRECEKCQNRFTTYERAEESILVVVKKDATLTEAAVREYCKANLTGYKQPKVVEFRTEMPKTPVGKILRRELRDKP